MYYKVKEVADIAGVSVRTLHHYDRIGLLKPDHVTGTGYRQYSEDNLKRLQQICFLKELDFPLKKIQELLSKDTGDVNVMLDKHKHLLELKVERLLRIIDTIDKTKNANKRGETMTDKEMFDGFDMSEIEAQKDKYAVEVEERWGNTDAYKQSAKKTAKYSADDWKHITAKTERAYKAMVELMEQGVMIEDDRVQELTGMLRQYITEDYYDCTKEIYAGLGQMYVLDERFTKNLDKHGKGFAKYLSDAIAYYCK